MSQIGPNAADTANAQVNPTSILPSRMRRRDGSGSLRSTKSSRSSHAPSSLRIRDPKTTTILGLSKRRGNTSAILTG